MSKKSDAEEARQEAAAHLKTLLKPGDKVYTQVTHVNSRGTARRILCVIGAGTDVVNISLWIAEALDLWRHSSQYGVWVGGCGQDMTWWLVEKKLSSVLFGKSDLLVRHHL